MMSKTLACAERYGIYKFVDTSCFLFIHFVLSLYYFILFDDCKMTKIGRNITSTCL